MINWDKPIQTSFKGSPAKRIARLTLGKYLNVIEYVDGCTGERECILCDDEGGTELCPAGLFVNVPEPERWVNLYVRCGAPWLGGVYNSFETAKRERSPDDLELQFVQTIKLP